METTCSVDDCTSPVYARGWCGRHYQRWQNTGSPTGTNRKTPEQRFWAKVDRDGPNGCWLWTGGCNNYGYGRFRLGERLVLVHRWSYESLVGPIPPGMDLDHLCNTRACVNPRHLSPTPHQANVVRSETTMAGINARKTHCKNGHPFDEENTRWYRGGRWCRACERDRHRK